ncbi:hypothetical protein [Bacillus sp. EB01]|uniref:hypothetical protein n=1 Tax=Bacillus sp. EB01 TaxID=1347086 RepID=UPI0005C6EB06|nr:hypothetical protein [Bacillus sp. EB01]
MKWKVNILLGLVACTASFLFSYMNNMWHVSLTRAGIGFLLFFMAGWVAQIVLGLLKVEEKETRQVTLLENESVPLPGEIAEQKEEQPFTGIPLELLHGKEEKLEMENASGTFRSGI